MTLKKDPVISFATNYARPDAERLPYDLPHENLAPDERSNVGAAKRASALPLTTARVFRALTTRRVQVRPLTARVSGLLERIMAPVIVPVLLGFNQPALFWVMSQSSSSV